MGHIEKTAADKSALGFEYQDLVLVDILVGLKAGESIGLEIFDDLHTENITNDLKLIQVKHSLLGGNITERDTDLWKTLYNWLESLPDLPKDKQIKFELYTNKNLNNQNLVDLLKNSKINKIKIVETIKTIYEDLVEAEKIKDKTASQHPILKFAEALASAEPESLDFILDRFEFHTDPSAINKKINDQLSYLAVPDTKIDETRKFIIGAYKDYKFKEICDSKKVLISYETFRTQMGFERILRSARSNDIDYERFYDKYYAFQNVEELSFLNSIFSNQLSDIGVSDADVIEHGMEMLATESLISELKDEGNFTYHDDLRLEQQCHYSWKSIHRDAHEIPVVTEAEHLHAAKTCYKATINKELRLKNISLPDGFSKGKFIKLSNTPTIGWKKDWAENYKK
jgi:hypothetical protein